MFLCLKLYEREPSGLYHCKDVFNAQSSCLGLWQGKLRFTTASLLHQASKPLQFFFLLLLPQTQLALKAFSQDNTLLF